VKFIEKLHKDLNWQKMVDGSRGVKKSFNFHVENALYLYNDHV